MAKKVKKIAEEPAIVTATAENNLENKSNIFEKQGELVVDIFETSAEFVVMSAIAGVTIKDLDISIEKDMMIIKGDRQNPHNNNEKNYFCQECYWGPFSKKVVLPENIKVEDASAEMDKGVLTVKFPKTEKNSREKLGIKAA
jgi:HSP20 family protein